MSILKTLFGKPTKVDTITGFDIVRRPDSDDIKVGEYLIRMYTSTYVFSMSFPHKYPGVHNIKRVKTRKAGEKVIAILEDYSFDNPADAFNLVKTL